MSEILACPNCDGPLTDSWLERAMDGSSGKRCESCTKAHHNPYGAAAELPLRRRQLVEAGNELARVMGDLEKATTALEEAQAQIAALKVEAAGMMKERDEARETANKFKTERDAARDLLSRMQDERDAVYQNDMIDRHNVYTAIRYRLALDPEEALINGATRVREERDKLRALNKQNADVHAQMEDFERNERWKAERERDAALADLSQARSERDEYRAERDADRALLDVAQRERAEARRERDALREEVERQKKHNELLDGSLRQERERRKQVQAACEKMHVANKALEAKLGRAVAALHKMQEARDICCTTDCNEALGHVPSCSKGLADAILADADSAAAGDAYELTRAVLFAADMLEQDVVDHDDWSGAAQALFTAVRKWRAVDARRGGGEVGASGHGICSCGAPKLANGKCVDCSVGI